MVAVRGAEFPKDRDAVAELWLAYLSWGNDELESRYGFRLPVEDAVQRDLAEVSKFQPPDGLLLLAVDAGEPIGTAAMRQIGPRTAEIKRMFVDPSRRRAGAGRAMLEALIASADEGGYERIRLDSPDFMTAAHALYRSEGFTDIEPYPESEIPHEHRSRWIFMEKRLGQAASRGEPATA
jgi:GNAT superfamily N-acetyltransferase